ncbi:MBL fold metallo-hydrolase [Kordia sp. YSTF-M3]|uniref:MBL fold metallo-hydrolase n=1 Tax=Kordia aestuariivivens TaxID=2759037 RepID=A0ABR7QE72_9FLAO|nr:MBL fold metallo-hydrolase [Kordia aestuariivivens]MBC8756867.1 MBL fold metallo-hydrolase [Kordia aestuariivivens]
MKIKNDDLVYIKENLVIEPLVNNWYAWPHLIPPATTALNLKERHLKIMASYIDTPQIHAAAVKDPRMLGGPFIDYNGQRVSEIQQLHDETLDECDDLLTLCNAISELNELLAPMSGMSLEPIYEKVPDVLKGYVELYYDLNNNASYRFYEELLYESEFYKENLQSFNLFLVQDDDSRNFVLSTPRLSTPKTIRFNIPFKDSRIDTLFGMTQTPLTFGEITKMMEVHADDVELFSTFFTTETPKKYTKYDGEGMLTRYFGHASILVETKDISILVDPVISYGYESDISRFTFSDLPETIDYVLFTHNHQDHILFETLLRIRHKIKNIIVPKANGGELQDPNVKTMLNKIGFTNVIELGVLEKLELSDCSIMGLPFLGEHCDLNIKSKLCHLVKFNKGHQILFVADSSNLEPEVYKKVSKVTGDIEAIFLGMECDGAPLSWLYGPLLPKPVKREEDRSRRLSGSDFEQAKSLIEIFNPKDVFVYAMGMEPWLKYITSVKYTEESRPIIESNKLLEYCEANGIEAERLFGEKVITYN